MGTQLPPEERAQPRLPHPVFGPCLLWPNGWMDQDASWYGGKPRRRRRCVRWGCSSPLKGAQPPVFVPCLLWPNGWMVEDTTWYGSRPRSRPHCVRRGPSSPAKWAQQPPPLFGPCRGHGCPSQLLLSSCSYVELAGCPSTFQRMLFIHYHLPVKIYWETLVAWAYDSFIHICVKQVDQLQLNTMR